MLGLEKKVAIIFPNFNSFQFVAETVNSIINQTYKNWNLIIVDDGAGGTNRKAAFSRVLTLTDGNATALAIALG